MHRDLPLNLEIRRASSPQSRERFGKAIGLLGSRIARSWEEDRRAARELGIAFAPAALLGFAALVFVVFGLKRAGLSTIYSDSLVFVVLAGAIGMLSPATGALLVIAIGAADIVWAIPDYNDGALRYGARGLGANLVVARGLVGRLVAYATLWLLVVELPLAVRSSMRSSAAAWGARYVGKASAIGAAMLAALTLTFAWRSAFPLFMRAPFVWGNDSAPSSLAIIPVQAEGWPITALNTIVAGVIGWAFTRRRDAVAPQTEESPGDRPRRFGWLPSRLLYLVLVGAVITKPIDFAILVPVVFVSPLLARAVWMLPGVAGTLQRIPPLLRFLVGYGIAIYIGQILVARIGYAHPRSTFFVVVIAIAAALVVFDLLFNPAGSRQSARKERTV